MSLLIPVAVCVTPLSFLLFPPLFYLIQLFKMQNLNDILQENMWFWNLLKEKKGDFFFSAKVASAYLGPFQ